MLPWIQRWGIQESPSWPKPLSSYPQPHWYNYRCQPLPRHLFIGILLIWEAGYFQPHFTDEGTERPLTGPILVYWETIRVISNTYTTYYMQKLSLS